MMNMNKLEDLLTSLNKKEDEKQKNAVLWALAIIGAVAAVEMCIRDRRKVFTSVDLRFGDGF